MMVRADSIPIGGKFYGIGRAEYMVVTVDHNATEAQPRETVEVVGLDTGLIEFYGGGVMVVEVAK